MINAAFLGIIIPLIFLILILHGENRLMMMFFSWGLVAFILSFTVNNFITTAFGLSFSLLSVTWAPIVEEFLKALPLLYFLLKDKKTDFPIIYFALASGIGFSIQENIIYLLNHLGTDGSPVLFMIIRSITTCLMHGMATAVIGYGLTLIGKYRVMVLPLLFGLFSISVTLHSLFNLYINSSLKLVGMVMPIILYIIGLIILLPEEEQKP